MSVVTPQFIIGVNTYDLPQANLFERRNDYTSIPVRMANGYVRWQTFAIQGDTDPGDMRYFTLAWPKLTEAEFAILFSVFTQMREGSRSTFRAPNAGVASVTLDPDQRTLDSDWFTSNSIWYCRVSIHLLQDSA